MNLHVSWYQWLGYPLVYPKVENKNVKSCNTSRKVQPVENTNNSDNNRKPKGKTLSIYIWFIWRDTLKEYIAAKHVLHAISVHEPDTLMLEIEEIICCIQNNKASDTFPDLSTKELAYLLEEFLKDEEESILIERTLSRMIKEQNVRTFIRNVLSS